MFKSQFSKVSLKRSYRNMNIRVDNINKGWGRFSLCFRINKSYQGGKHHGSALLGESSARKNLFFSSNLGTMARVSSPEMGTADW